MNNRSLLQIKRIVFWEPCISPHKEDFFSAIKNIKPDIEVICCANSNLSSERQSQGWRIKTSDKFQTILSPNQAQIDQLVTEYLDTTLHVFSGIRWVPSIIAGLKSVKRNRAKFAIMSEPRVREGWKGELRFLHSWLTEGWLRKNSQFVLAQGGNGPSWFKSVGYPENKIFPFAYFIDPPKQLDSLSHKLRDSNLLIHVGYVGRLVKMKGVFDLINAVAKLGSVVQLSIVGSGSEEQALRTKCQELHLDANFLGVMPIQEVSSFMNKLDVLVLASTSKDGWGVVVSEALMTGTAVIATPFVGASIVLSKSSFGKCVPAKSPDSIAQAIIELQSQDAYSEDMRIQRAILARQCLSAESGARYFLDIIEWRFLLAARPAPFYEIKAVN
ncbi:glycosyltransferase [Methylotenera sp. G11]|uniref:glycosyltransferase n=1 Tax=Methylotenera sp. G11 TaxID=1506585 RepID=UPI000645D87E|nr:glycosyltransferase [Methylotenera sp. G11]